ncbi:MAG: diguanylate cyclase, partial [Thiovulaceae bacterium]|nr:diguanylate cyclase [Sulfurimonadaceae bacterium]
MEYILFIIFIFFFLSLLYNIKLRKTINRYESEKLFIAQSAFYDTVTDLPNRNNIEIIIKEHINITSRHNKSFHVFAIKANEYKDLKNNSIEKSNELSREIADAILSSIRDEDTTARVSEDEYIIVFNEYLEEKNYQIPINRIKESLKNIN